MAAIPDTLSTRAVGLNQINFDLQRQCNAYDQLRGIIIEIRNAIGQPGYDKAQLPILLVRVPTGSDKPDMFEFPLSGLGNTDLHLLPPVFDAMLRTAHERMLAAWRSAQNVITEVAPMIVSEEGQAASLLREHAQHLPDQLPMADTLPATATAALQMSTQQVFPADFVPETGAGPLQASPIAAAMYTPPTLQHSNPAVLPPVEPVNEPLPPGPGPLPYIQHG